MWKDAAFWFASWNQIKKNVQYPLFSKVCDSQLFRVLLMTMNYLIGGRRGCRCWLTNEVTLGGFRPHVRSGRWFEYLIQYLNCCQPPTFATDFVNAGWKIITCLQHYLFITSLTYPYPPWNDFFLRLIYFFKNISASVLGVIFRLEVGRRPQHSAWQ